MQGKGIKQRIKILKLLTQKGFISGEEIARRCGISRISAWKHITYLISQGVKIKIYPNKGYEFLGFGKRLLPEIIWLHLGDSEIIKEIIYLDEIDSTNEYAKKILKPDTLIIAEQQKRGKGRFGRRWHSQKYKDLLFSVILSPQVPYSYAGIFSIIGVLSVPRALNKLYKIKARGKWPNDVIVNGRKICGVLIEFFAYMDFISELIIGIGVNVNSVPGLRNTTSVKKILSQDVSRVEVLSYIIKELSNYYQFILDGNYSRIRKDWLRYSEDCKHKVALTQAGKKIIGRSEGIDEYGNLVMKTGQRILIIPPVSDARLKIL
jgi:BirA family biotin operon repressor/biotin-[acetyl-CoA-carboxylase] ligase